MTKPNLTKSSAQTAGTATRNTDGHTPTGSTKRKIYAIAAAMMAAIILILCFVIYAAGPGSRIHVEAAGGNYVLGGQWVPVENTVNAWYWITPDGVHHGDCFSSDGYYVEANGVRMLTKPILDVQVPMRNSWLTAGAAGGFDCFVPIASQIQQSMQANLGKYRTLTVYSNHILLTSIVQQNDTTYMVDRMGMYKDTDIDGYTIMIATSLGGDRKRMEGAIGNVDLIAYYDYEILRFMTNSVSRSGDLLASAIYSHWQDENEHGIKLGEWVKIGDTMVRYMPIDGKGMYEIKAAF
ncbi:MAG: hypothetical protein IJT34_00255 [Butyrivibrio sp.]|nr:hypothetical protein [Butyrivibrio sp.]